MLITKQTRLALRQKQSFHSKYQEADMKKNLLGKSIIAIVLATMTVVSASALEATVLSTKGKVEVQKGNDWVAVKEGDTIQKGAIISTGFKSEAVLKVKESTFKLSPLTRITIEQLASTSTKDETQMYLDSGSVSFNVKKSENKRVGFKVRSPAATASVRGTEGTSCADGTNITRSGLVSVGAPESSSAGVVEGDATTTSTDGKSSPLTPTTDVGGSAGDTPVFAGQSTKVDDMTGMQTPPQTQMSNDSHGLNSSTTSLATVEAPKEGNAVPPINSADRESPGMKYGTVTVSISWK
jgi:hypothetical protein